MPNFKFVLNLAFVVHFIVQKSDYNIKLNTKILSRRYVSIILHSYMQLHVKINEMLHALKARYVHAGCKVKEPR